MFNGRQIKCLFMFVSITMLLVLASRQAHGKPNWSPPPPPLVVGTCLGASPYTTIQSAVSAAPSGGTVLVCPGTYPEQVTITQPLNLKGVQAGNMDAAVVTSPAGGVVFNTTNFTHGWPAAGQVLVQNTTGVNISNLTVDGSGNQLSACSPLLTAYLIGIYYQNASGSVNSVATRNQITNGCYAIGIYGETEGSATANFQIFNASVHSYGSAGIVTNQPGMTSKIVGNSIVGPGPTAPLYQYGIQVGFGATSDVEGNTLVDNVALVGSGYLDISIFIVYSSGAKVANNTVGNSNYGIATQTGSGAPADHTTIIGNTVLATHNDGYTSYVGDAIDVCSNNNFIFGNNLYASDESGIHLDSSCGSTGNNNVVDHNTINEACAGILADTTTTGNTVKPDNLFFNDVNTLLSADGCYPGVFPDPPAAGAAAPAHGGLPAI
jgi:hypothetical protein